MKLRSAYKQFGTLKPSIFLTAVFLFFGGLPTTSLASRPIEPGKPFRACTQIFNSRGPLLYPNPQRLEKQDLKTSVLHASWINRLPRLSKLEAITSDARFDTSIVLFSKKTLDFSGKLQGKFGGNYNIITKFGDYWGSGYSHGMLDPEGDPRMFSIMIPHNTATFFGFYAYGKNSITVPDVTEVNGAIRAANEIFVKNNLEPIEINYKAAPNDETLSEREFLEDAAYRQSIPYATDGHYSIHDASFHLPSILFPPVILKMTNLQTRRILEFIKFLETNPNAGKLGKKRLEFLIDTIIKLRSMDFDVGTGKMGSDYRYLINGMDGRNRMNIRENLSRLIGNDGRTPDGALKEYFEKIINEDGFKLDLTATEISVLKSLMGEFLKIESSYASLKLDDLSQEYIKVKNDHIKSYSRVEEFEVNPNEVVLTMIMGRLKQFSVLKNYLE